MYIEENKAKLEDAIKNQLLLESNVGKMIRIICINNLLNPEISEISGELVSIHRFDRVIIKTESAFHYIDFASLNNIIIFIESEKGIKIFKNNDLNPQFQKLNPLLLKEKIRNSLFGSVIVDAERRYREDVKFRFTQNPTGIDGWKELEKYIDDEYKETYENAFDENSFARKITVKI